MIGFDQEPISERGHISEEPETRHLDKRELYNMLAHRLYLPPLTSRGVTRDYLLKVHREQYFRVPLLELKHFEVELTPAMMKRVGLQNNALLMKKLNALLVSRKQKELGFETFDPPDEVDTVQAGMALPRSKVHRPVQSTRVL